MPREVLSERLSVSNQTVSKRGLCDATPEVDKMIDLAEVFWITADMLLIESGKVASEAPKAAGKAETSATLKRDF